MIHYLSLGEVADMLGYSFNTIKSYWRKGMLPEPDAKVGRNHGWLPATIREWQAHRLDKPK